MKKITQAENAKSGAPVIVVQAFIKMDTLSKCLDSLRACMGAKDFRLVIFQDGLDGNPHMSKYEKEHQETKDFIERWVETHEAAFQSIEFHPQTQGRGTTRTCKLSVDYTIVGAPFVLFAEDDIIFEKDSLTYAQQIIATPDWTDPDVWVAALESVFFDSCHVNVLPRDIKECRQIARDQDLISKYIRRKELPPSCFVVTADKWAEWSETRGMAGSMMVFLHRRLQEEGKTVLWPIVARARDVGMLHPKGYSMKLRKGNVFQQKNTFLMSGDLEADGVVAPVLYEKSIKPLLDRTRKRFEADLSQSNFPLHMAAFFGQTDNIATLLDAGADHNARDEEWLHPAAHRGQAEQGGRHPSAHQRRGRSQRAQQRRRDSAAHRGLSRPDSCHRSAARRRGRSQRAQQRRRDSAAHRGLSRPDSCHRSAARRRGRSQRARQERPYPLRSDPRGLPGCRNIGLPASEGHPVRLTPPTFSYFSLPMGRHRELVRGRRN